VLIWVDAYSGFTRFRLHQVCIPAIFLNPVKSGYNQISSQIGVCQCNCSIFSSLLIKCLIKRSWPVKWCIHNFSVIGMIIIQNPWPFHKFHQNTDIPKMHWTVLPLYSSPQHCRGISSIRCLVLWFQNMFFPNLALVLLVGFEIVKSGTTLMLVKIV